MLYEKTLQQSMVDKSIDQKESEKLDKIDNHYLDKRKEYMDSTNFKVEDVFGDVINKDSLSQEQIHKSNIFSAKML